MEGSCQCGAVIFITPTVKPHHIWHCHCTDCQKQSASAFGTSAFFPYFGLDSTNSNINKFTRTCDSGRKQNCYFCKRCGTRLIHEPIPENGGTPEFVAVKGGTLKGLNWKDAAHIWCRSAVVPVPEGVLRSEQAPDFKVPWY